MDNIVATVGRRFCGNYMLTLVLVILGLMPRVAAESQAVTRVAIIDSIRSTTSIAATNQLVESLTTAKLSIPDLDQSYVAARGAGYEGSLNLELEQARNLGAVLGCEFYIIVDAQTIRRSYPSGETYLESYASLFVVSTATGRLITWLRPSFESPFESQSEQLLWTELSGPGIRQQILTSIKRAQEDEQLHRQIRFGNVEPKIEEAPDEQKAKAEGWRLPRPFKRLQPQYTDDAARADIEATVDAIADIDTNGDVTGVRINRWAGFGLDEATAETVKRLKFFPAMRNGAPVPLRVLLRYNFRRPRR